MRGVNKQILVGNLGSDPELKQLANGRKVCNVSLATNEQWTGPSGESIEHTEWHNLVFWGGLADIISQYGKSGNPIYVEATLRTRKYSGEGGEERSIRESHVKEITLLGDNKVA
ncbi:MAG: single-stranded DNA-binding protein [Roseivirga sp.]|nr:single-stranded DNA-binding protein [Roseivirga sp.]